jgi:class 3 adenylate cyclase/tetratricopeptide (TPR) repeat protein
MGDLVATVYQACDLGGDNECAVGPALAAQLSTDTPLAAPFEAYALVAPAEQSSQVARYDSTDGISRATDPADLTRLARYLPSAISDRLSDPAAALAGQSEHRQVTVLFAYVELGTSDNDCDPEAIATINDRLAECFDIIRDERGSIARIDPYMTGHKLLVLFGAPIRHGHDELNALACARRLLQQSDERFRLRIGLATGPLYCGNVGAAQRREYTVMGGGINMAARLMAKADAQQILIDQQLRDRLPEQVQTEPITLALKGVGSQVTVYRFVGLSDTERDQLDCDTVVGQSAELDQVAALWSSAREGQTQVVTITAESGVGKTTFLQRLRRRLSDEPCLMLDGAQAVLHDNGWLARLLLEALLQPAVSDHGSLRHLIADRTEDRWLPLLADFLNEEIPDNRWTRGLSPELRLAKTGEIFSSLIRSALTSPQILLIDDLDRTDELSQTLIRAVLDTSDLPLLAVATACTEIAPPAEENSPNCYTQVELAAPTIAQWQEHFAETFEPDHRETDFLARVLEVSGGNPQFITQFLGQCREDQIIVANPISGKWELASTGVDIVPPENLTNLSLAALDRLPQTERYMLKCASVTLVDFTLADLRLLADEIPPDQHRKFLEHMVSAGHLLTGSTPGRYHFARRSMRDAVYGCLPEAILRGLHSRCAEILESSSEAVPDSVLAYHLFRAGDDRRGFDYSYRSARKASEVHSPGEASRYFDQCEQILHRTSFDRLSEPRLFEFHDDFAQFLVHEGEHGRAYRIIRRWRRWARSTESRSQLLKATITTAGVLWQQSLYGRCRVFLEAILRQPTDTIDPVLLARTNTYLAQVERRTGEFKNAVVAAQKSIELARTCKDIPAEASAHNELGLALWSAGKLTEAATAFENCLELSSQVESMYDAAKTTNNLAIIYWELGDLLTAERLMSQAVETFRSTGDRRNESYASGNIASLYRIFGQIRQSRERFQRADLIFERFGDRHAHFYTVGNLGDLDLILGNLDQAADRFDQALEFACSVGDKELEAECRIRQGEVAFFSDKFERAEKLYDQAMELAREVGSSEYLIRGSVGRARLMLKLRRVDEALENVKTIKDEADRNNAEISGFEAVFLKAECDRINGHTDQANQAYRVTLEYARRQKVFELALKCAARLFEFDPDSTDDAAATIQALIGEYEQANAPAGFDEVTNSVYYSYFAATVNQVPCPRITVESPTA